MKKNFKKLTITLTAFATIGLTSATLINPADAATSAKSRSYGVDVSGYQGSSLSTDAKYGAQFAIVKVSEGTSYQNPKAASQIASAKSNDLLPMAYHFANFSSSSSQASKEAAFAVASVKKFGLPAGSYLACDWEASSYNRVTGNTSSNTAAIKTFMKAVKAAGYQPLLYSGAYVLRNNVNTGSITSDYPNSLWVASYATTGAVSSADFKYFPSMNGVIIWQFTDNWRGLNVDGNISVLPLSYTPSSQAPKAKKAKNQKTIMHKSIIYDANGNSTGKMISAYNKVTVIGGAVSINNLYFYKIGDNQFVRLTNVDGYSLVLKHNAYVYKNNGKRVKKSKTLKKGNSQKVYGDPMTLNGTSYYRIGKNRYVKAVNFN